MTTPLHIVVLAAGQGSRMKSSLPKVLHSLAGQPLLHHVLEAGRSLGPDGLHVVVGHGADQVREQTPGNDIHWVIQKEQLGTGHAVAQALPGIPETARVLVLYGDVPLTSADTLSRLAGVISRDSLGLLTVNLPDPAGYGRILRDSRGTVTGIVEQKDATPEQLVITEVNTGLLGAPAERLKQWLPALSSNNAQGEYYLTDIIALGRQEGLGIEVSQPDEPEEVQGVNNRAQLAELERWFQRQQALLLMAGGATLADPSRVDVRGHLETGQDVVIDVNTVFEGAVVLGDRVQIGPGVVLRNCRLDSDVRVDAHSVIEGARVDQGAVIGPFARLRPDALVGRDARVGNFVEIKKSSIGEGAKVNHLSYVGDTTMGAGVNVGAGTITCNYDGTSKHHTTIRDGAFIGSNTSLVAPVTLGERSLVGAGSTITRDVADRELAVARGRQRNIPDWVPVEDGRDSEQGGS
ncbi:MULTISPECIES: bifunctional UDP-N-acetylglucosamine diphosphorylase/glucosamine-1-phosphate N-acetyltransferase GlmU [Halomonadaceae]|uniref:Bifunctional protein GlmU n=1 Tax=Vreelandella halophila TaxID=86177 RepID=A0A9X4YB22_9GAMM|nr:MULTISPECIES: bifunctional UDP-N-acetylglucosamine diphosphorylase/glucosamine-1-phosphate N-acetyltransferase GlmU [Halomonas]MYL25938.1 UDP-N-acetylglucosamine diphosphorylase/glucosamine-1-phosphate N-acetyltransferase [Halomonas utahensis]MYL73500.1 UDP-N-acetylglucosamine diphosphorylase/glucosamine-1-phosphate N-acetyltransferase [Halomonas sp. 22501_18_FS]